jgi:hypothetical protein
MPETGPPASADENYPYAMVGQAWYVTDKPSHDNGFAVTLSGARAVTLATLRMNLQDWQPIHGTITTSDQLTLTLTGRWPPRLSASLDGQPVPLVRAGGAVEVTVPAGLHKLTLSR